MNDAFARSVHPRFAPAWAALAVAVAAGEVALDATTPAEVNFAIVYGLPLLFAAASRNMRLLWALATLLVVATFAVFAAKPAVEADGGLLLDRLLAAVTLLLTSAVLHALSVANARLAAYQEQLERERNEAEEARERSTRLLLSVSHDVRTPLTSIRLSAQLIARSVDPDAGVLPLVDRIDANARSLADMVTDVLDDADIGSGRLSLRESVFPLDELVAGECSALEPLAAARSLSIAHGRIGVGIRADRTKLARVLRNLLENAVKYTEVGGVTVALQVVPDGRVAIRVRDTGVGIALKDRGRVFGEYMRVGESGADSSKGWGLGLPICRRLARLMDGELTVESEEGRGSVFTVWLPAYRVVAAKEHAREARIPAAKTAVS